jgi:predicted chitinase
MIDIDKFITSYLVNRNLNDHQRHGLTVLLNAINGDSEVQDIRWAAYMLATVMHECAGTWLPIEEYGHGKGRPYGVADPATSQVYYGRGYVQLTWKANYRAMSKVMGLDLVAGPALALNTVNAYRIMSYGMRNGSFTGVGLKRFINGTGCDYVGARKIINGTDQAAKIAGYAREFEAMLKASLK